MYERFGPYRPISTSYPNGPSLSCNWRKFVMRGIYVSYHMGFHRLYRLLAFTTSHRRFHMCCLFSRLPKEALAADKVGKTARANGPRQLDLFFSAFMYFLPINLVVGFTYAFFEVHRNNICYCTKMKRIFYVSFDT